VFATICNAQSLSGGFVSSGQINSKNDSQIGTLIPYTFEGESSIIIHGFVFQEIVLGLEETISEKVILNFYPNPATDLLSIKSEKTFKHVTIYDLEGHEVYDSFFDHSFFYEIKISDLPKQLLLLKIQFSNGAESYYKVLKR
jgi:hypothetical protein